jgi:hypothetical protein
LSPRIRRYAGYSAERQAHVQYRKREKSMTPHAAYS